MMRFSLAVAIILAVISANSLAQQKGTLKVKPSAPEKEKKAVPIANAPAGKSASPASASAANAKNLQALEHQTARSSGTRPAGKKAGTASALKPVKDKPNPPINFNGTGRHKSAGTTNAGSDPYRGRLRQKGAGHQ